MYPVAGDSLVDVTLHIGSKTALAMSLTAFSHPIGTFCMQKHLDEIGKQILPGNHGVIIFDQAAWHTTKKLRLPENISLLALPPASPELNPTEQEWQVLRDRYLGNRSFDSYEQILDSCCMAWNAFTAQAGAVRQLCTREWAKIKTYFS